MTSSFCLDSHGVVQQQRFRRTFRRLSIRNGAIRTAVESKLEEDQRYHKAFGTRLSCSAGAAGTGETRLSRTTQNQVGISGRSSENGGIPRGRVKDVDAWVQMSSDSLERLTGKSLFDELRERAAGGGGGGPGDGSIDVVVPRTVRQVHDCGRFAVLSHGAQEDPVYNYFNRGALETFRYPEDEIYQIPSRKSAPEGRARSDRSSLMKEMDEVVLIPSAIRKGKYGNLFRLTDVLLWNVYDDRGALVGQTATFDREKIVPLDDEQH